MTTLTRPQKLRVAFFVVAVFALNVGTPLTLWGIPVSPSWRMFRGFKEDMCFVRTFDRDRPIDRYALLGEDRQRADAGVRRLRNQKHAKKLGARLCEAIGPGAQVRVELTCGSDEGWVEPVVVEACK